MTTLKKVNLGCGRFPKPGLINVDWDPNSGAQVIHDLNVLPYPFKDQEIDEVEADHVFEHLNSPFQVMREMHRILKPGGRLLVRVPHFSRGFTHPEHARGFNVTFPFYFQPSFEGGYTGVEFELKSLTLKWFAQPYLAKKILSKPVFYTMFFLGKILDVVANFSPAACSRIWCYWVGGFEEVEFIFFKPKK